MPSQPHHVVAIPARDEADHIAACLKSLAGQAEHVVLLVNNSRDGTGDVARAAAAMAGLPLTVHERTFAPALCNAGHARRCVMGLAADLVPDGVLLTTDADARVAPDWIAANLRHLASGADAVAGRALIDPVDAATIPRRLHEDDARECRLGELLDEIAAILDPDPADPWPRHTEHSGASICVSTSAFRRVGGMPDRALGEDRAFFAALRQADAAIRHAPDVTVTVSGRIVGRARGGMADTMRRRITAPDPFLDDRIEPVPSAVRRARLRATARVVWKDPEHAELSARLAYELGLSPAALARFLAVPMFGGAWAEIEENCPVLAPTLVPAADVEPQIRAARAVLDSIRVSQGLRTGPSDRSRLVDALPA